MRGNDAVEYTMAGLSAEAPTGDHPSLALARAFADRRPIDPLLGQGPIRAKDLERDLKRFLASELRRAAKDRGVPIDSLCDVTERTLRTWAGDRKN